MWNSEQSICMVDHGQNVIDNVIKYGVIIEIIMEYKDFQEYRVYVDGSILNIRLNR